MWEAARSQEMARTVSPPEGGQGENHSFCSAAGSRASGTHIVKERPISLSSEFSGSWADSVQRTASSLLPVTYLASDQESAVGGHRASPRTSSQSLRGLREFCEDESERKAFCTIQLYSPSLHHRGYADYAVGATCTASGGVSRTQFDSATRFSSPGDLPSSAAFSRLRWHLGTLLSYARRLLSSWQRMQSSWSIQPRCGRGFTALTSLYPRKAVVFDQSWIATPEPGPAQAPVQDVDTQAHDQMHTAPGFFAAIDLKDAYFHVLILLRHRPFLRFASEGRAWQYRVLPFGLSLSPRVFTKVAEGALAPLQEVGIRAYRSQGEPCPMG